MRSIIFLFVIICISNVFGQVSVSGFSSGGFAAVQYHIIYSSTLQGAGILAGGPYYCANGELGIAVSACMVAPELISVDELELATSYAYDLGDIDNPTNLQNQKVWLYSGTQDTTVYPGVVQALQQYYSAYVSTSNIETVFNISSVHTYPTDDFGNACTYFGTPFINNCNFEASGHLLRHIYGDLVAATNYSTSDILTINQANYVPSGYTAESAGLANNAYYFLPSSQCKSGCKLHIAFNGCEQTIADIGMDFVQKTGYNNWGESNDIIILYPQAITTLLNPNGCWDWWGYTTSEYATKNGPQMGTVYNMAQYLQQKYNVQ